MRAKGKKGGKIRTRISLEGAQNSQDLKRAVGGVEQQEKLEEKKAINSWQRAG